MSKPVRLLLMVVGIAICAWIIRLTALFGVSRMYQRYSQATGNVWVAERAVEMTPLDVDAHRTKAVVIKTQSAPEAVAELERAVVLRPSDYSLWVELGLARDQNGDTTGALTAFNEAIKRAPFYALPYWQRGNLLLRMGQYDAGFADLNRAAQSNPNLIPGFIDLAWSISKRDAKMTTELVRVDTRSAHTALANFFSSRGEPEETLRQLRAAGPINDDLRVILMVNLIAKENFAEAYQVWSGNWSDNASPPTASIFDGGFESALSFDQRGFGWRIPHQQQAISISLDSTEPHSGGKNLRIEFAGDSPPATNVASQLLIVDPSRQYQVSLAVRSQDIVSGGLPVIVITDAAAGGKLLGKSAPVSKGTTGWTVMSFNFTTGPATRAVVLGVQRENCTSAPCPIFGVLSLDSFSLAALK